MSTEPAPGVTAFLESYRMAFERLDAPAIAGHFAYPSHITSDTGEIVLMPIAAGDDWVLQIERLLEPIAPRVGGWRYLVIRNATRSAIC